VAMGTVYRAEDTELSRQIAIKVLNTTGSRHRRAKAHGAARRKSSPVLNIPGLFRFHDVGFARGRSRVLCDEACARLPA